MSFDFSPNSDIDEIMRCIRNEVRRSESAVASAPARGALPAVDSAESPLGRRAQLEGPGETEAEHVDQARGLLSLDGEEFLDNAYRVILGRHLDDSGRHRFLEPLRSRRMSRLELLARLRLSKEGRARGVPIERHLVIRGIARAAFNIPVVGYLVALVNYIAKLPTLARTLESTEADVRLARNTFVQEMQSLEWRLQQSVAKFQQRTTDDIWGGLNAKVDKEPFWELAATTVTRRELGDMLASKLDAMEFHEFRKTAVERADLARVLDGKVDLTLYEHGITELSTACWNAIDAKLDLEVYDQREARHLRPPGEANDGDHPVDLLWQALNSKVDKDWIFARQSEIRGSLAELQTLQHRMARQLQQQKVMQLDQQRHVNLLLREVRARLPEELSRDQLATMSSVDADWLDAHYVSFEDVFRGSREDIKARAEVYLPIMRAAGVGNAERRVIDIGCGRGEFLELLTENGLIVQGVDRNRYLLSYCRGLGLDVIDADAIDHLMGLPSDSVGAVTGFHIIEHVPFERLVKLLDECLRVIKPGGVVAFETPNPENLVVGAFKFWYDPTHLNPVPPDVSRFLLEARGFVDVEIKRLTESRYVDELAEVPSGKPGADEMNRIIRHINKYFAAETDYAIIGYKA
jgi:SAM-dependent methyltransferase